MRLLSKLCLLSVLLLLMAGCVGLSAPGQEPTLPPPTFDPALLTVTSPPTSTLLPTYTPFPTAQRLPSRTPLAVIPPDLEEPLVTTTPGLVDSGGGGGGGGGGGAAPEATPGEPVPTSTQSGYVGIQGAGPEVADLAPILTIVGDGSICNEWMLVQVGVINRGTGPAYNFHVEWSLGWGAELQTEFVEELQWGTLPIYFYNGTIRVPCEESTSYVAWIRLDVYDDVAELFEDNNYEEEIYTVTYLPPNH